MIIHLKQLNDLEKWWPYFKQGIKQLDPKAIHTDLNTIQQHICKILSTHQEGYAAINLDNEDCLGFIIMKRKLSLISSNLEYDTLLYYFKPLHKNSLFELLAGFESWAKAVGAKRYFFETLSPKIFLKSRDIIQLTKHSITLKKEF